MKNLLIISCLVCVPLMSFSHGDHEGNEDGADRAELVQEYNPEIESGPLTEFPTLHPLVVHFPIVLMILAALMHMAGLFFYSNIYNITVTVILALSFLSALLAAFVFHPHTVQLSGDVYELFEEHEHMAFYAIWLSGIALAAKTAGLFMRKMVFQHIATATLIAAAVCIGIAAHHGGELVHKHGIGPKGHMLDEHHD